MIIWTQDQSDRNHFPQAWHAKAPLWRRVNWLLLVGVPVVWLLAAWGVWAILRLLGVGA